MSGDYDIGANGLVIRWEPALLGNALSSLANLFVFSRRTGVSAVYPYIDTDAELFQRGSPKYIGLAPSATAKADAIVCDLDRYLSGHPVLIKPL